MPQDPADLLTEPARRAIRSYLVKLAAVVGGVLGALNVLGLIYVVPRLAAGEVTRSEQLSRAQLEVARTQFESLVGAGTATEKLRVALEQLIDVEKRLKKSGEKVAALEGSEAMKLSGQLEVLRSLGANSQEVLTRLDAILKDIPTRIVVTKTQPLGWGNRNSHSQFCSDRERSDGRRCDRHYESRLLTVLRYADAW